MLPTDLLDTAITKEHQFEFGNPLFGHLALLETALIAVCDTYATRMACQNWSQIGLGNLYRTKKM
jgi:hypothetical protein